MSTLAPEKKAEAQQDGQFDRRALLVGVGAAAAAVVGAPLLRRAWADKATVFIARNQRYDGPLEQTIRDGLAATGFDHALIRGRKVLLKPNLVEPTKKCPQMTTHPAVVVAVANVFRNFGAEVVVGEGPGHMRDTEMALVESGMQDALDDAGLRFVDLNYSQTGWIKNAGRATVLDGFHFPREVLEADLIVSLPKMKTHHWVGYTGALKNLYGVIPGIKYGWPKNVLHYAGIPQSIYDINATLPKTISVVDGILAMEGDGPIMGSAKPMGLILVGTNNTAVDATLGRIMGFEPSKIEYLNLAGGRLGPIGDGLIGQHGERWRDVENPFTLIDAPQLRGLRRRGVLVT